MTRRKRYKKLWPSVQDYLDCDNPKRTNQATRSMHQFQNPQFREQQRQSMLKRMQSAETRAHLRQKSLALWQDPAYRAKQLRVRAEQATIQHYHQQRWGNRDKGTQHSEKMRARWSDPAYKQRMSARMRDAQQDPARRQRQSEISRLRWQDPAFKQRMSAIMKRAQQRRRTAR